MNRYILSLLAVISLVFAGCATTSPVSKPQAQEPFPGPMHFSGDFDQAPKIRFFPKTVYPPFLIQRGESGSATIVFTIKKDGYVEKAEVESASEPAFGASALGTVGRMVFRPAIRDGASVSVVGRVTFPFEIK